MQVNNVNFQSIWYDHKIKKVNVIDQRRLPFHFEVIEIKSIEDAYFAIKDMIVRGAPLIGVTAAYGLYLGVKNSPIVSQDKIIEFADYLKSSRPTAVNLAIVIDSIVKTVLLRTGSPDFEHVLLKEAQKAEKNELNYCEKIGEFGLGLIESISKKKSGKPVNILTHCNAGWLACVDWGTATAPMYKAHLKGIPIHVWVDETRPRNQGARLTAWEMESAGIPYTLIPDNTGGHLMQHNLVDLVIVGSDRTTRNGDVANKIGTYLKALAAYDNAIPFYVALPSTSIDFNMIDGVKNIPIEERNGDEVKKMECLDGNETKEVLLMPENTPVANYGFDVTPAKYVTALITERGICQANEKSILNLFQEYK